MQISKTATEHPKLVHLTADRPKIKNRRPPLKKYTTFHEDDSKEVIMSFIRYYKLCPKHALLQRGTV